MYTHNLSSDLHSDLSLLPLEQKPSLDPLSAAACFPAGLCLDHFRDMMKS